MICSVCAIGLHYLILKFLSVNLFLWGHELANSFLLFSVHKSFLQIIKKIFFEAQVAFLAHIIIRFAGRKHFPLHTKWYKDRKLKWQLLEFHHRKPILYVCLISFLWYHGVERNISKCMGWNQLWWYLGEYWNKLNFTCLICSWSLSWSLVAISSHFNRF